VSASFSAIWSPTGIARKAVVGTLAPVETFAAEAAVVDVERAVAAEWGREAFDPASDADPFEWLGFAPESD
jgi:hypothetical protein